MSTFDYRSQIEHELQQLDMVAQHKDLEFAKSLWNSPNDSASATVDLVAQFAGSILIEDLGRFEAEIRMAAEVGALAVRTVIMPGRRYEQFKSLAEFKEFETRGRQMLERAAPIVTKHRVRLAVENHKD